MTESPATTESQHEVNFLREKIAGYEKEITLLKNEINALQLTLRGGEWDKDESLALKEKPSTADAAATL